MLSTEFDIPERIVPHRAKAYEVENRRTLNGPYGDLTGMISSAEDLVRLGVALNHGQLLKPNTLALMYKPQLSPVIEYQEHGPAKKLEFEQALIWKDPQRRGRAATCLPHRQREGIQLCVGKLSRPGFRDR